ncbi:MAG: CoA-binding protein [Actinomycetota bacterium]|nr:CoA-binding protein [Actinomycetota bacterium]
MPRGNVQTIRRLLRLPVWAIVGLTANRARPAYGVAAFLQAQGKQIVPVNPTGETVLGQTGYPDLAAIGFPVDVVEIFRRSDAAGQHVDEAIRAGAGAVWLQLGVIDEGAADRAVAAGLDVVMDHCPHIEWPTHGPAHR